MNSFNEFDSRILCAVVDEDALFPSSSVSSRQLNLCFCCWVWPTKKKKKQTRNRRQTNAQNYKCPFDKYHRNSCFVPSLVAETIWNNFFSSSLTIFLFVCALFSFYGRSKSVKLIASVSRTDWLVHSRLPRAIAIPCEIFLFIFHFIFWFLPFWSFPFG